MWRRVFDEWIVYKFLQASGLVVPTPLSPGRITLAKFVPLVFQLLTVFLPGFSEADELQHRVEAVLARYPALQPEPFGYGIFAHVRRPGGRISTRTPVAQLAQEQHVAGSQLSYSWAELEPRYGVYNWELLEKDLEIWATHGKKCWIEISTCDRRGTGRRAALATPAWLYEQEVPKIQGKSTATYPVFWNAEYQRIWGQFIREFAARYDGDPRIEFISTGGYSAGHEPNLTARDNQVLMDQWKAAGFDGFHVGGVYHKRAVVPILEMFTEAFRQTPLAQTIHVKTPLDDAVNKFAASHGFILLSNGLSTKVATARGRTEWSRRKERYKAKLGYAEWGPTGRRIRRRSQIATVKQVYQGVLGEEGNAELQPVSKLSYLPLGQRIPSVETEAEWREALKWASEHLHRE